MDVFMSVEVSNACGSARGEDPASPLAAAAHEGHLSSLSGAVLRRVTKTRPVVFPPASLQGGI